VLVTFIVLAALGLVLVALGGVLLLIASGEARELTAQEVGEDIIRRQTRDTAGESPLFEEAVFEGKGGGTAVAASVSFADVKADWRAGRRRKALPPILILFGFTGLLVFLSLALLVGLDSPLAGAVMLGATVLSLGRMVLAFIRA